MPLLTLIKTVVADDFQDPKFSLAAENAAKERFATVRQELKTLDDHPWAGEYYKGDGKGLVVWLAIAPKSGFVFEWNSCLGPVDRNYGAVHESKGQLKLDFTFEKNDSGHQVITTELVPVRWGPRRYLVIGSNVIGFCNQVNSGREPRDDMYGLVSLRLGDEKLKVTGLPDVPEKYRPYLLDRPIDAEIIAVGEATSKPGLANTVFRFTPVTVNKGTDDGLLAGMEFLVTSPNQVFNRVHIKSQAPDHSEGVIMQLVDKHTVFPTVGWKLSTRAPWRKTSQRTAPS
ncbi:MAG: hypothetical protein KF708_18580 [Pirellulales bacterium]|nr:hypothetical protein [Pirellulales bacterium]